MKTLMKFSALVAVAMFCGSAAADYLYSMVKDAYYYFNGESADFDYLKVKGDGNDLDFYGAGESDSLGSMIYSDPNDSNSSYGAQLQAATRRSCLRCSTRARQSASPGRSFQGTLC